MRIFQTALEMVKEVERDLFEMGIRYQSATVQDQYVSNNPDYQTLELTGYSYALTGLLDAISPMKYLGGNVAWAMTEAKERVWPSNVHPNPGVAWKEDRDKWEKFLRDGVFSYSYAERWQYQLPYVIRELKARPNSRQAIMTMYDVHQDMMNWGGRDRVPCSLSYQFLLRDDKLTLIYTQRSCDFLSFFATDVYLSVRLLQHVAAEIDATPVRFIHQIGSLHAFAKDLEGRGIF